MLPSYTKNLVIFKVTQDKMIIILKHEKWSITPKIKANYNQRIKNFKNLEQRIGIRLVK